MSGRDRDDSLPRHVAGNIETIMQLEEAALATRSRGERIADRVVAVAGSTLFLAFQLLLAACWIAVNAATPAWRFDPFPFPLLNLVIASEAMLLTIFVLSKQNRLGHRADRRAHLDLQVNLLSEKEITAALQMLTLVSERLGIDPQHADPEITEMQGSTAVEELARDLHEKLPD